MNIGLLAMTNHPIITLQHVSFVRNKKPILSDVSWEIRRGEHWALIGANGSGKTSLLKIITGYEWPTAGTVEVLGKRFGSVDLRELRKSIGWVSSDLQERMQQTFTVQDVVMSVYESTIGVRKDRVLTSPKILKVLREKMELMGIAGLSDQLFPLLSYGEQKRALIARSLMHDPKLLILDEPCTGLDLKAREEFLPFIESLGKKKDGPTIIMTTHHIEEIVPVISHIMALKDGKVVEKDNKQSIMNIEKIKDIFDIDLSVSEQNGRYWLQSAH